jgi:glycosyltransferase involved in cell wall biosynthesis
VKCAIVRTHLQVGGVEVNLQHIAIELKKAGHNVDVYVWSGNNIGMLELYRKNDIPIKRGNPKRFHDYDVIICWDPRQYPALQAFQNTLVCIVGNRKAQYYSAEIRDRFPVKGCICDSNDTIDYVRDFSKDVEIFKWHYLIPPDELALPRIGDDTIVFGTLCSMRAQKRIDRVIQAYKTYLNIDPSSNSKLVMAGDGPMKNKWMELAKSKLPKDHYHFTGFIPPEQIPQFLQTVDCFVNVVNKEEGGICMSLANAVGAGCFPLANNVAGIAENFEGGVSHFLHSDEDFDIEAPKRMLELVNMKEFLKDIRIRNQKAYRFRYNKLRGLTQWLENLSRCSA